MAKNISKLKKNLIGLELGSSGVKLVVADFNKDSLNVRQVVTSPLPDQVYTDGDIKDPEVLAQVVKTTLKQHKIKSRDCFCCMESNQVITREVTIPASNKGHLADMAKFEVEQFLPVELDNYEVQSILLKEMEIDDKPYAEMLVTAFPKGIIHQIHHAVAGAGLRALVLDTQANSFAKLIEKQNKINGNTDFKEGMTAFIDFGNESINVQIFRNGQYVFNRALRFGARDMDTNISKFLDLSLEEAKLRKLQVQNINYVIDETTEQGRLVNVVRSTMNNWLDEIVKIFRYYGSRSQGKAVDIIYMYGGLSNLTGISDFVENRFKVPASQLKKVDGIELPSGIGLYDIVNTLGVLYRR